MKLSDKEIARRIQEWRNIKILHEKSRTRNEKLKKKNKRQKQEIKKLKVDNLALQALVEKQALQIEELQKIVFGKKKKDYDEKDDFDNSNKPKKEKKPRSKKSYRREKPKPEDITEIRKHEINNCPDCGEELRRKKLIIYWEEDIPLPVAEGEKGHNIIEHQVEKGYCLKCKKWHRAQEIPPKKVVLGQKVKFFVCYLNILLRMSYSQIRHFLRDIYHFKISDGEIAKIMEKGAIKLRPEFERIKKKLQESKGVHLDETSWHKLYLWVMTGIESDDVIYLAGKNRGNGNIDDLLSKDFNGVRVSDAYPAYKNKSGEGQQCWSHPHRKIRDLAKSKKLSKTKRKHCQKAYKKFSEIYEALRNYIQEPFEKTKREQQKQTLQEEINSFRKPQKCDPEKLKNIRKQFYTYEKEWLACMDYENVPCDNNKAERMLRHFIIKRKISFGTRNEKSSETFQILASVFMSIWQKNKNSDNFIKNIFNSFAW